MFKKIIAIIALMTGFALNGTTINAHANEIDFNNSILEYMQGYIEEEILEEDSDIVVDASTETNTGAVTLPENATNPENPNGEEGGVTNPENPNGEEGGVTNPENPNGEEGGVTNPENPNGEEGGVTNPENPNGEEGGVTNPEEPNGDDIIGLYPIGPSIPTNPDGNEGEEGGVTNPEEPNGDDIIGLYPIGPSIPTNPDGNEGEEGGENITPEEPNGNDSTDSQPSIESPDSEIGNLDNSIDFGKDSHASINKEDALSIIVKRENLDNQLDEPKKQGTSTEESIKDETNQVNTDFEIIKSEDINKEECTIIDITSEILLYFNNKDFLIEFKPGHEWIGFIEDNPPNKWFNYLLKLSGLKNFNQDIKSNKKEP